MSACLHRAILLTIAMLALFGCSEEDAQPKASATAPATAVPAVPAVPAAPTTPSEAVFSTEQLDQMLAPLALYPDALLAQALESFDGSRSELARHLGLSERTLYRRLRELGL